MRTVFSLNKSHKSLTIWAEASAADASIQLTRIIMFPPGKDNTVSCYEEKLRHVHLGIKCKQVMKGED